jgi:hypothetical protein
MTKPVYSNEHHASTEVANIYEEFFTLVKPFVTKLAAEDWNSYEMLHLLYSALEIRYLLARAEERTKKLKQPELVNTDFTQSGPHGP